MRPFEALAAYELGLTYQRRHQQGDLPLARASLTEAARLFDELGMPWYLERAKCGLQDMRRTRANPRLTPEEENVARLCARGLSNQQIAGVRTVEVCTVKTQVSHILRKLALRNRTEIGRWVSQNLEQENDAP